MDYEQCVDECKMDYEENDFGCMDQCHEECMEYDKEEKWDEDKEDEWEEEEEEW